MDKFSELKAAAMAATPGPWISGDDSWSDGDHANISTADRYDSGIINIAQVDGGGSESGFDEPFSTEQQANARYITAANPAVILALLAELEAKDKRIEELNSIIRRRDKQIERAEGLEDDVNFWKQRCLDLEASSEISTITPTAWHFAGSATEGPQLGYDDELDEGQKANCIPLYMRHEIPKMVSTAGLRIAELSRLLTHNIERAESAEKQLATPVRLPKRWDVSGQVNPPRIVEVQFEQQNRTHDQCAKAIRDAGFTVEGDE